MNSYNSKKNTRSKSESLGFRPDSVTISLQDPERTILFLSLCPDLEDLVAAHDAFCASFWL